MISKGGFGKVWLVKHNKTQDLYAMKIIDSEEKVITSNTVLPFVNSLSFIDERE